MNNNDFGDFWTWLKRMVVETANDFRDIRKGLTCFFGVTKKSGRLREVLELIGGTSILMLCAGATVEYHWVFVFPAVIGVLLIIHSIYLEDKRYTLEKKSG